MSRNVNEWLASGEAKKAKMSENIEVGTTITFGGGSDGAFDGLFTRVDENGNVVGYRAVNQDIEMVASDATNITIADTETLLVELTIDNDVSKENGSWAVACKINNGSSSRDDIVNLIMRDNAGNALSSKSFQIDKGDSGYPIAMWGTFANDFASGEKFKLYATSGRVSVCAGTLTPTTLKAIEAQAAPVSAMATAEKALVLSPEVNSPSKQDLLDALGANSESELIDFDFTAMATNGNEFWQVFFSHQLDEFFTHQITLASNGIKPDIAKDIELHASVAFGNGISRSEIENLITARGYKLPTRNVTFFARDADDKIWFVRYFASIDKYGIERLNLK
jgi:hypothetical protein